MPVFCLLPKTKKSPQFKKLANDYYVHEQELEGAILLWGKKSSDPINKANILDDKNLLDFLDDYFKNYYVEYEDERLYNKLKGIYDRHFAKKGYIISNTIEKAEKNYDVLVGYFGEEHVGFYKSPNGNYVFRVAEPTLVAKSKPKSADSKKQTPRTTTTQDTTETEKKNVGPEKIRYILGGDKQEYTVQKAGYTYHIYDEEGKEAFKNSAVDRQRLIGLYEVAKGNAVLLDVKNRKYLVYKNGDVISYASGFEMDAEMLGNEYNEIIECEF